MNDWFAEALEACALGNQDKALDIVYDIVDNMLLSARFDDADQALREIDVPNTPIVILVGLLTITLLANDRLPSRSAFFEAVRAECIARGRTGTDQLLKGLDMEMR